MWTLTSTARRLRDQATRSLYWFGRTDPEGLFALTIDSLTVNDAYVSERMLAATYGVVMSGQQTGAGFGSQLGQFLSHLVSALIGASATAPTHHYLARLYARGIIAFAAKFYAATLPAAVSGGWSFASPPAVPPLVDGDADADEAGQTLHMDFENYTIGRLFDDRANYDMDHTGHKAALAHVRGVVWTLGWRAATFERIDARIGEDAYRYGRDEQGAVERYGKKYGWIGFYTYAGFLEDSGTFPKGLEFSDVDIDPSFPEKAPVDGPSSVPDAWLGAGVDSHEEWVRTSATSLPLSVLRREVIGEHRGPWIAVHGHFRAEDRVLGRLAWAFVSAMVVAKKHERQFVTALKSGTRPWRARQVPEDHYVFAGEIPWHPRFAEVALSEDGYRENVRVGTRNINVEALAHGYAWESYHSEMNRAGRALVPSKVFSERFDLRGVAQWFDQFLPDGRRASITLSGVDGLEGDLLYLHEDLLAQYVGNRVIVWLAFGERELRPFPASPPEWLVAAQREYANAWAVVVSEKELAAPLARVNGAGRPTVPKRATGKPGVKAKAKRTASKAAKKKASRAHVSTRKRSRGRHS